MIKTLSFFVALSMLSATSIPAAEAGQAGPRTSSVSVEPAMAAAVDGDDEQKPSVAAFQKRSPVLAGTLSLVLPGAGQIYNEHYFVGGLWMAAEIALYMGAFAYAGAFDSSEEFSLNWRLEGILLLAVAGSFHLFSIFDAATEAHRNNENIDKFSLMVAPTDGGVTVGYGFVW